MTYTPKIVKEILKTFIEEHIDESVSVNGTNGEWFLANEAIFEIENYFVQLRKNYKVNERFDTTISSDSIMKSIGNSSSKKAFTPINYEYNFLSHLAANFINNRSLNSLINSFILEYKAHFTLADIIITATGATRCKTNIRFALNNLRDLGLVISRDKNNKRSWSPSLIGLVVFLNSRFSTLPASSDKTEEITVLQYVEKLDEKTFEFANRNQLQLSVYQIKQPGYIYTYFTKQEEIALDDIEKEILNNLLEQYAEFTHVGLKITENGVTQTAMFNEKSIEFYKNLFSVQDSNPMLFEKLFHHFRKKK